MKKLEKTLTRDISLLFASLWHHILTVDLKQWLGWGYSDSFYYFHEGYVDMLRSSGEHWTEFKNKVLERINKDKNWFFEEVERFKIEIKNTSAFFRKCEQELESATLLDVNSLYQDYKRIFQRAAPLFIVVFWLPQWLEKIPRYEKYSSELNLAVAVRKQSEFFFAGGDKISNMFLSRVNRDLRIDSNLLKVLSEDDFLDFLRKGIKQKEKHLVVRLSGFIFSSRGITLIGDDKKSLAEYLKKLGYYYEEEKDTFNIDKIRGVSAYKGTMLGNIKIILSKSKICEFQEGEILVAAMTTPEYLPAMEKAAAVITDEGGILSHAAISARELKKPCIIGTKIATKVLKDGDVVEVDADRGVVTILKKVHEIRVRKETQDNGKK